MYLKWIGAALICVSCSGFGMLMAGSYRNAIKGLRSLVAVIDYMECDLGYRLTPLASLCRSAAMACGGTLSGLLQDFAAELDEQISPEPSQCMAATLARNPLLHEQVAQLLRELGNCFGKFDLVGQLKELDAIRQRARGILEQMELNKDTRVRSYQTLGICAGAALAILLI